MIRTPSSLKRRFVHMEALAEHEGGVFFDGPPEEPAIVCAEVGEMGYLVDEDGPGVAQQVTQAFKTGPCEEPDSRLNIHPLQEETGCFLD